MQLSSVAALLGVCILIRPAGLAANEGFSYFGDYKLTVVPYSAAFILYAFYLWKLSEITGFATQRFRMLSLSLRAMAVLTIGLAITPSDLINSIHVIFGGALFGLQFVVSLWLSGWWLRNWLTISLFAVELIGGLICFYYLPMTQGLLLQGQAIFQLAFSALLIVVLNGFYSTQH